MESCARRMMSSFWANDLIAPCAVSQCPVVADRPAGVGSKRELPAKADNAFFDLKLPQQEYRAMNGPTVSTAKAAEPPSFMLTPSNRSAPSDPARTAPGAMRSQAGFAQQHS